ncbi:MAG: hypothetical protein MJ062_05530 [Oscillospiraceae bacterium]|nr:hypothetical protein [Oscillospiraceae bacterium]
MATTSLKTMNPFLSNFRGIVRKNRLLMIFLTFLSLLGLPVLLFVGVELRKYDSEMSDYYAAPNEAVTTPQDMSEIFQTTLTIVSILAMVVIVFMIANAAIQAFSYLLKKSDTDLYFSLPMNHNQRFFSCYLGGLTVWLLPTLISNIITAAVLSIMEAPTEFFLCLLIYDLVALWLYTLTVMCVNFCGNHLSLAFALVVFGVLTSFIANDASVQLIQMQCVYKGAFFEYFLSHLAGPLGPTFRDFGFDVILYECNRAQIGLYCLLGFAACIVLEFLAAWFVHGKRKAETVSKPFPIRSAYHLMQFFTVMFVVILFTEISAENAVYPYMEWERPLLYPLLAVIACLLILLILDLITTRNLKKMPRRIAGYVLATAAAFIVFFGLNYTHFLGFGDRTPSKLGLVEVKAEMENTTLYLREPANVDSINEVLAESRKTMPSEAALIIDIEYNYGNKQKFYGMPIPNEQKEALEQMIHSTSNKEFWCTMLKKILDANNSDAHMLQFGTKYSPYDNNFGYLSVPKLSAEDCDRLLEAYRKDWDSSGWTANDFKYYEYFFQSRVVYDALYGEYREYLEETMDDGTQLWFMGQFPGSRLYIPEAFKNTIAVMEDILPVPTIEDVFRENDLKLIPKQEFAFGETWGFYREIPPEDYIKLDAKAFKALYHHIHTSYDDMGDVAGAIPIEDYRWLYLDKAGDAIINNYFKDQLQKIYNAESADS